MSYTVWCILLLSISLVGLSVSVWFMCYSVRERELTPGKENNYIVFVGKELKVDDDKEYVIQYNKNKTKTIDGKTYYSMSIIKER